MQDIGELFKVEKNGKGQEYIKHYNSFGNEESYLIYEGKYLNGKRHGKGKEYYFYVVNIRLDYVLHDLIFEGEFFEGQKWNGKGKEYNKYRLEFEGEYLNGKKNGKGKEYNYKGNLKFEGEYLNGKKNGKGKAYWNGKLEFEGEYLNGNRIEKRKE